MPPAKTKRTLKKKIAKSKAKVKSKTVTLPPQQRKEPVVTDKVKLQLAQQQVRESSLVVQELMQINADLTLTIARQRATMKQARAQQPGSGG